MKPCVEIETKFCLTQQILEVMNQAIKTANFKEEIETVATGFQITIYSNRVLVIISQTQTFGSILLAR